MSNEKVVSMTTCADCGAPCPGSPDEYVQYESARYGLYYTGDYLCDKCRGKRYEEFVRKKEREDE